MTARLVYRKATNAVMLTLTGVSALLAVSVLFFILGYLLWHGGTSLNWDFFTKLPVPVGETGGGMANAIVGSAKLLLLATLIGVPIGFLGGVYVAEFGGSTFSFIVRYTTDLLNGVPSIVIGIFAYTVIIVRQHHFSTFAGGIALGVMMIPIPKGGIYEGVDGVERAGAVLGIHDVMITAAEGPTYPEAGVIATSPATDPEIAPNTLGLPVCIHSATIQESAAAAAAIAAAYGAHPA